MSETAQPIEFFDVYETDDEDEDEALVGAAELHADFTLHVTGGAPDKAAYLADIFTRVNAKPEISSKAPPPAGAGRFELGAVTVKRGEEGFLDALQVYLMTYYGLRLG